MSTNCLSEFGHFVGLAPKGSINSFKFAKGQFCKSGTHLKLLQRTRIKFTINLTLTKKSIHNSLKDIVKQT